MELQMITLYWSKLKPNSIEPMRAMQDFSALAVLAPARLHSTFAPLSLLVRLRLDRVPI